MSGTPDDRQARFERCQAYLQADPTNPHLLREAIDHAIALGAFEQAVDWLATAQARHPADAGFRFQHATLHLARRDWASAATLLRVLLDGGHDHPAIRFNLAFASQQLGAPDVVAEQLGSLSEDDLEALPDASVMLARARHHLGDIDAGRQLLRSHLARHPDDADGWGVLALMAYDEEDNAEAARAAEQALARQPDSSEALLTLAGIAVDAQDPDTALPYLDRAIEAHPGHGRAWSSRGFAHMLNLDLDQAEHDFREAVKSMPNHIGTWHGLAWLAILRDRFDEAEAYMRQAMALDRNFSETHGTLAVLALMQGRDAEAEPLMQRALRLDRNSYAGRLAQSMLLSRSGRHGEADAVSQAMVDGLTFQGGRGLQQMMAEAVARKMRRTQ